MRLIGRVGLLRRPFAGVEMIDRPVRSIKVAVHATEELAQTSAGPIVFRNPSPRPETGRYKEYGVGRRHVAHIAYLL